MNERVKIEFEVAKSMLPDGDTVHTFRNSSTMLIGAYWNKKDILTAIEKYGVELSGPQATRMKHGLILTDDRGHLFIETKEKKPRTEG